MEMKAIDFNTAENKAKALNGDFGPKAKYVAEKKLSGDWKGGDTPDKKFSKVSTNAKPAYSKA